MRIFRHLRDLLGYLQLTDAQRVLTVYSEGKSYWPHLVGLIREILSRDVVDIAYISSDPGNPGLALQHARWRSFLTDEGMIRNWLFENIDTRYMLMTMPDLDQYQVKRSRNPVQYIYVQHSLVSLHMVYREGAFDFYDHIFCAGPHHVKEMRAIEKQRNLARKNLVEHGYERLDQLISDAGSFSLCSVITSEKQPHILIAPSWSEQGIVESGFGEGMIDQLLNLGFKVTLRPHPQTVKLAPDKIKQLLDRFSSQKNFHYEANIAGSESLFASSMMISDWSGAALDYALSLSKPVLFIDLPRKVNNPQYQELDIEPLEVSIRDKVGQVIPPDISLINRELLNQVLDKKVNAEPLVFNSGGASRAGTDAILALVVGV